MDVELPPSGTVTFLFTDIEGSTGLWERDQEAMKVALERHDRILREAFAAAGGYVFSTAGDSFAVAFARAGDAVQAAVAGQRGLVAEKWLEAEPIRVRMGLHTGEADERDGDYFGPAVNRAARVMGAAHGGQMLMSATTAQIIGSDNSLDLSLVELGTYRLRGVRAPERLWQIEVDGLVRDFPPPQAEGRLKFGDFEIDLAAVEVRENGVSLDFEPQVFEVLVYLAQKRDRVVTKTELRDSVWGDRFVSESALTSRIKSARRLVGDDGRAQKVIRTVHGRGYQFVAEIDTAEQPSNGTPVSLRPTVGDGFVGRDDELGSLLESLTSQRLVTVVGAGGVGKTRLATEAARAWEEAGQSVDIVELDSVASHTQVAHQICDVLGVRSEGDIDLIALAAQQLRGSAHLLVLDNFEHVRDAATQVTQLLELAPDLRICVTSRERLRVSGEQVMPLQPLDATLDRGLDAPALVLFQSLARRHDPAFTVDDSNAALVADICVLVDGLPLGLDLAAAQLSYMPLEYLRTHLEKNSAAIGHELQDRPERQRTVNDLIGWSYNQLTPTEQRLLGRLSVFRGGIPLSGVRAVGELESDVDALQSVAGLIDKSLVVAEVSGTEPRYSVLNLIRSFAGERLAAGGDETAARSLHAAWTADLVTRIEADRWGHNLAGSQDDLSREYPNINVALTHLCEAGDHVTLGRIVADTNLWWYRNGRHAEARRWVGITLERPDVLGPQDLGRVHFLAGMLAFAGQDMAQALDHYRRAAELAEQADDWRYLQLSRSYIAIRALADPEVLPEATAELEAVAAAATDRDEPAVLAHALNTLGVLLHRTGREAEARAHHERAVQVNRRIGDRFHEALGHANLGHIEVEAGRPESALVSAKVALTLASRTGASLLAAWMLSEIASSEQMRGNSEEAAILMGASDAYIDAIGAHHGPAAHQSWHELTLERLRDDLGDAEFERLHGVGGSLPFQEAVERALTL